MDKKEYLQPDFDPKILKVAQLRNLFVEYDVEYPSSAKKNELVDIFNREIKPKLADLLKKLDNITADGTGIVEMPRKLQDLNNIEVDIADNGPVEEIKPKKKKKKSKDGDHKVKKSKKKSQLLVIEDVKNDDDDDDDEENGSIILAKKEMKKLKKLKTPSPLISDSEADTSVETHFSKKNVFQKASMSPESKKGTPVKSKLDLTLIKSELREEEGEEEETSHGSDSFDLKSFKKSPKSVIPKKRSGDDNDDDDKEKKKLKSPSPTTAKTKTDHKNHKVSVLDQKKFEEGPDLFVKSPSKRSPVKNIIMSPKVEQSFKSIASIVDESFASVAQDSDLSKFEDANDTNTTKFEDAIDNDDEKLKEFISVSPKITNKLKKKKNIISSPLHDQKKSNISSPKGPKRQLGYVDEIGDDKIEMKFITPSIEDEEEELKRLQDEMSIHMESTEEKVDKIEDELALEEASLIVENEVKFIFVKFLKGFIGAIVALFTLIFVIWYFDQMQKIGFCGYEVFERTFEIENVDQFDFELILSNHFSPKCSPCPEHGNCGHYLELSCDEDFIVKHPWYSLGGLIPTAGDCIPDKVKQERINDMVRYTLELLRQRNAENCGRESDETVGLSTDEIHDVLKESMDDDSLNDLKFEELWQKALTDLQDEPEITIRQLRSKKSRDQQDQNSTNDKKDDEEEEEEEQDEIQILRSSSKSKFSIKCKFQELIYHQLNKYKKLILGLISIVLIFILCKIRYDRYIINRDNIDKLTLLITRKLVQQNKIASRDNTGLTRDYLAVVQLRDILIDNLNKNKSKLWNQVVKRVSKNSNIEERTIEVGGEIIKIWKWIGVDVDEDELL